MKSLATLKYCPSDSYFEVNKYCVLGFKKTWHLVPVGIVIDQSFGQQLAVIRMRVHDSPNHLQKPDTLRKLIATSNSHRDQPVKQWVYFKGVSYRGMKQHVRVQQRSLRPSVLQASDLTDCGNSAFLLLNSLHLVKFFFFSPWYAEYEPSVNVYKQTMSDT